MFQAYVLLPVFLALLLFCSVVAMKNKHCLKCCKIEIICIYIPLFIFLPMGLVAVFEKRISQLFCSTVYNYYFYIGLLLCFHVFHLLNIRLSQLANYLYYSFCLSFSLRPPCPTSHNFRISHCKTLVCNLIPTHYLDFLVYDGIRFHV